ncbi:MAG: protein kinase [Polyangiaceae bacterium]|nr:protein kinase [Polyangiaceae bacterium]
MCPHDGAELLPDQAFVGSDKPLEPGTIVGEYRVEDVVAEGGFGTVFRCIHPVIGKSAAIKVLKREFSSNPEMVARFISEARAVNQIRHKNIVDIFSFGQLPDGRHYYVMELLEGITLDRLVHQRGRLPIAEALPIIRQLGRALGAAHAAGITHRDIKPENVFLVYDDEGVPTAKLLDFGIAKLVDVNQSVQVTRPGAPMGTPLYMSPEQVYGRSIDHRSDIYSFGILTFEVLAGATPFDGETVMDVLTAQTTTRAPAISTVSAEVPVELDAPILAMLEKDPQKRPASITLAIDGLMAAAERAGLVARNSTPSGRQANAGRITPAPARELAQTAPLPSPAPSDPNASRPGSVTPAVATTMSSLAGRMTPDPAARRSRGPLAAGIVVVAGGILAALFFATRPPPTAPTENAHGLPPPTTPSGSSATLVTPAPPVTSSTSSATAAPAANSVRLSFDGVPPDAEVVLGTKPIGSAGPGIDLARGNEKVKLTIRKSGFLPREVWIVPDRDRTVMTDLVKTTGGSGRPRAPGTGTPTTPGGDLEF